MEAFPASVRAVAHVYLERLDDRVSVEGDDAHHLGRVLRVRDGETVTAADGHGRWRAYEIVTSGGPVVTLRAMTGLTHEPRLAPTVTVACSLTKGEKPELAVQKLTELGVDGVVLVRAARSVVQWDDARSGRALERLARVAREAGSQSRRARLPVIDGPVSVGELAATPGLVVADPAGVDPGELPVPPDSGWTVAIGPEGGYDDAELAVLAHAPRLRLSPHVLRAETAAIAAAAVLLGHRSAVTPREREE